LFENSDFLALPQTNNAANSIGTVANKLLPGNTIVLGGGGHPLTNSLIQDNTYTSSNILNEFTANNSTSTLHLSMDTTTYQSLFTTGGNNAETWVTHAGASGYAIYTYIPAAPSRARDHGPAGLGADRAGRPR
jgi:hypothetical protein